MTGPLEDGSVSNPSSWTVVNGGAVAHHGMGNQKTSYTCMEVAYGKLRGYYKSNPRKAEEFFLREGSRRKPK